MPRARRTRYKVEDLGIAELVQALLLRGETYDSIREELQRQGHDVGRSSIARFNRDIQRQMEAIRKSKEAAEALKSVLRQEGDDSVVDTEMTDLLIASISHNLLSATAEDDLKVKDVVGLAMAIAKLASSKTQVEKLKQDARKQYASAWKKAAAELRGLLEQAGHWPLVEEVLARHDPMREGA